MANNTRDVELTLTAKDKASAQLAKVGKSLADLQKQQEKNARAQADAERKLLALREKSAGKLSPNQRAKTDASIDAQTAALARLKAQAEQTAKAVAQTQRVYDLRKQLADQSAYNEANRVAAQRMLESEQRMKQLRIDRLNAARQERIEQEKIAANALPGRGGFVGPVPRSPLPQPTTPRAQGADPTRTSLDLYQRARGQILSLTAAYLGLYAAIDQVTRAIDEQRTLAKAGTRLGVALGTDDPEAIAAEMAFVREQADRLGQAFVPLADSYSKFAASAALSGATLEQTRAVFVSLTEASTAFGLSADDTKGVFRATEQIFSKGKVTAEELRGQLGERLPAAMAIMAKSLGVTTAELNKMLEQGEVTSNAMVGFAIEMARAVEQQLPAAVKNLNAEIGRLETAASDARAAFMEGFSGPLSEAMAELTAAFSSPEAREGLVLLGKALGELAVFLAKNIELIATLAGVLQAFTVGKMATELLVAEKAAAAATGAMGGLRAALVVLGRAVTAHPIGAALVLAITAGVAATQLFTEETDRAAAAAEKQAAAVKRSADAQKEEVRAMEEARALMQALTADRKLYTDGLKKTTETLRADIALLKTAGTEGEATARVYQNTQKELEKLTELQEQNARAKKQLSARAAGIDFAKLSKSEQDAAFAEMKAQGIAQEETDRLIGEMRSALLENQSRELAKIESDREEKAQQEREKGVREAERAAKEIADSQQELRDIETRLLQERAQATDDLALSIEVLNRRYAEQAGEIRNNATASETEKQRLLALSEAARKAEETELRKRDEEKRVKTLAEGSTSLEAARDARIEAVNTRRESGLETEISAQEKIQQIYADTEAEIRSLKQAELEYYTQKAELGDPAAKAEVERLKAELVELTALKDSVQAAKAQQLKEEFADGLAGALTDMATGAKSAKEALQDFFSSFLANIAQAIIQKRVLAAIEGASGQGSAIGGVISFLGGLIHTGGIVGQTGMSRSGIPATAFASPAYFHTGGVAGGLKRDEMAAVLQRGEEVLTRNDPRHVLNGGGKQKAPQVNVAPPAVTVTINGDDLVEKALLKGSPGVVRALRDVAARNRMF
jgi:tape measure domain-containing protein